MILVTWEWNDYKGCNYTYDVRPIEILDVNDFWLTVMKNYTIEFME